MIHNIPEPDYRLMKELNYSKLKEFDTDSRRYYIKYVRGEDLGDKEAEQEKEAMRFGSLVDCILTGEQDLDWRYQISKANIPTGQMLDFVQSLYKNTLAYTRNGVLTESMEFLYQIGYQEAGFKRDTFEKVLERFVKEGKDYYGELRDRGTRVVISPDEYEKACSLAEKLRTHPFSAPTINIMSDERFDVHYQLVLTGNIYGYDMKCMMDKVIIDNRDKVVYIYDLKTTANGAMFQYNYTKMRYYLQMAIYTLLARLNYPDYEVKPLRFLVCDRTMYYDPLVYTSTEKHLEQAINGFTIKGKKYRGLKELLEDYKYALENNCFTTTVEAHKAKGKLSLEIFDDL